MLDRGSTLKLVILVIQCSKTNLKHINKSHIQLGAPKEGADQLAAAASGVRLQLRAAASGVRLQVGCGKWGAAATACRLQPGAVQILKDAVTYFVGRKIYVCTGR
jgi:hypothetical protein